jgi:hypothetical protein
MCLSNACACFSRTWLQGSCQHVHSEAPSPESGFLSLVRNRNPHILHGPTRLSARGGKVSLFSAPYLESFASKGFAFVQFSNISWHLAFFFITA